MLRALPIPDAPELLVGAGTGDDAAVWLLDDERALIVTVDVITPVVDDARSWGRVAATNAVSDVYAMGGTPLLALNIVHWNNDELPLSMLADALAGIGDVATAGRFALAGGHTITDPEPKLGLAVVGLAHPGRLLTNAGLRPGQVLVLTKPLGIGIVTTAIKRGLAPDGAADAAIASMIRSNAVAAACALDAGATGATDITGFGLLGHVGRMAIESGVDVEVAFGSVPLLPGADALARAGVFPGGAQRNLDAVMSRLEIDGLAETEVSVLADPQTSGGLCFGVDPDRVGGVLDRLAADGHPGAVVGTVRPGTGRLLLRR